MSVKGLGRVRWSVLTGAERLLLATARPSSAPQVFILGLPRSGTTLIYQYLVHRLDLAYFTNGVGKYPYAPCTVTWLQRRRHGAYHSDFRSSYGKVSGPVAPREAGAFWARFFGYEGVVDPSDLANEDTETLRRTVARVQQMFGDVPFVNKNVKHMLRVRALAAVFPQSHFLVVERNHADVALSVLRARFQNGDASEWWSVKPGGHQELAGSPPAEQVAHQVVALEHQLQTDTGQLPANRVHRIGYESFCAAPESLIKTVSSAIGEAAHRNPPVARFKASRAEPRTVEERRLLELLEASPARKLPQGGPVP